MVSNTPKILHRVAGKAIVHHVLDVALALNPKEVVTVVSPHIDPKTVIQDRPVKVAVQHQSQGTGDAVRVGLEALQHTGQHTHGNVLVLCGDVPLIQAEDLNDFLTAYQQHAEESIGVLGMRLTDPRHYGRLVTENGNKLTSIVEYKDATPEIHQINLCNTGIILAPQAVLKKLLPELSCQNAAQEYYLTDIIALGKNQGVDSFVTEAGNPDVFHGINNRVELALAERQYQQRLRRRMMLSGVTLIDPDTVYFSHDTIIGQDTLVYPNVFFGEGVTIEEEVTVYPNCQLVKTTVGKGAKIGPFAHLREHTILETKAEIGNFVEVKKSTLGIGAKAKHLSYVGDTTVGAKANIGAGVITCNYDGINKHQTTIGEGAFVGSNSALIAPVSIGNGAMIGAGSVITKAVPDHALGVAREKQKIILNWVKSFRQGNTKDKG